MYPYFNTDYYGTIDRDKSGSKGKKGVKRVDSNSSMASTTNTRRDIVVVWMWRPWEDLKRGEVIAFWSPRDPEKMLVKRVIAVEGDYIKGRDASNSIGQRRGEGGEGGVDGDGNLQSPTKRIVEGAFGEIVAISSGSNLHYLGPGWEQVPQGHVWVEGENGAEGGRWSQDSNAYGPISTGLIVGKLKAVVYPFGKAGRIRWEDWKGDDGRVREGDLQERIEAYYNA